MHWHIILTEKCNSQCRYCYEKSNSIQEFENKLDEKFDFDFSEPCISKVSVERLKEFLLKDENPVLIFYGGEPLLQTEKIKKIIDSLENTPLKFRMQTNGILLDKLPIKYLKKIDKILVSLDGDKKRTDLNRGEGTFEKVYQNIQKMKSRGYNGEIIARMTIAQDCPDIYKQIINLINLGFESIHWQLDVGFYKSDYKKEKIQNFFEEYNKNISELINWWIEEMKKGKVYRLYPFVGIINPLLNKKEFCGLRCGAGNCGYAISTSGKIVACPIMNNIKDFEAGTLETEIKNLKKFSCQEECSACEVYGLCGGRCMYWKKTNLWNKEGNEFVCNSIKFYIAELKKIMPKIESLISKKIICKEDFDYEEYFGPEIIP
jgi:uncharacterized protein